MLRLTLLGIQPRLPVTKVFSSYFWSMEPNRECNYRFDSAHSAARDGDSCFCGIFFPIGELDH